MTKRVARPAHMEGGSSPSQVCKSFHVDMTSPHRTRVALLVVIACDGIAPIGRGGGGAHSSSAVAWSTQMAYHWRSLWVFTLLSDGLLQVVWFRAGEENDHGTDVVRGAFLLHNIGGRQLQNGKHPCDVGNHERP